MGSWLVGLGVEGSVFLLFCDPFGFCGLFGLADSFFLGCAFFFLWQVCFDFTCILLVFDLLAGVIR